MDCFFEVARKVQQCQEICDAAYDFLVELSENKIRNITTIMSIQCEAAIDTARKSDATVAQLAVDKNDAEWRIKFMEMENSFAAERWYYVGGLIVLFLILVAIVFLFVKLWSSKKSAIRINQTFQNPPLAAAAGGAAIASDVVNNAA